MGLPVIVVEFGQQRQRLNLNKLVLTGRELLELFSTTFHIACQSATYEVLLVNQRLDPMTEVNFSQLEYCPRFQIRLTKNPTQHWFGRTDSDMDELISLKQRLSTASTEISNVAVLLSSIQRNCQNLIERLVDEESKSNGDFQARSFAALPAPSGFRSLPDQTTAGDQGSVNSSSQGSSSPDEGIDRDIGGVSIFEPAHCGRENNAVINKPQCVALNEKSKLEWRNQPNRSRPFWNRHSVKSKPYHSKDQSDGKPRVKKPANANKAPLPPEKKKNIPCKYAAGGNCKRGKPLIWKSIPQTDCCKFRQSMPFYSCGLTQFSLANCILISGAC